MSSVKYLFGQKGHHAGATEALIAFVQSLDMNSRDELTICSGVLDVIRAYMGDRPCCVWKKSESKMERLCERGMIEVFFETDSGAHAQALSRAMASGTSEFDPCKISSISPEFKNGFDGF